MKNRGIATILLLAAMFGICSCGSDEETVQPVGPGEGEFFNCRVIQSEREGFSTKTYTYDTQGRITTFVNGSYTYETSYNGNEVIMEHYSSGELSRTETVTLNDAGFAIIVEKDHEVESLDDEKTVYEYNAKNELIKKTVTYEGRTTERITVYQWVDGNMVAESKPDLSDMTTYTYSDKADQPCTWHSLQNVERGYKLIVNKNRLATLTQDDGDVYSYSYSTNDDGLITSITTNTPDFSYTQSYSYECD